MIEERYNYKAIKDHCKMVMSKEGKSQEELAKKLGVTQQNIAYALSEKNRMQPIIWDLFLEMDYEITMTPSFVKINKMVRR